MSRAPRTWPRPVAGVLAGLLAALVLGGCRTNPAEAAAAPPGRPRQIFAHYMGCFPAGTGPTAYYRAMEPQLRHDRRDYVLSLGGRTRNWPLLPPGPKLSAEASADLEIRRAIRIGLDGFSMDAWAGQDGAKATLDALFKVAEEKDYPFQLTICLDPSCHPASKSKDQPEAMIEDFAKSIKWLLDKHGQSPKLARRDGKPLIFGYSSRIVPRLKGPEDQEQWAKIPAAYREIERRVGTPLYFHYAMEHFFVGCELNRWPESRPPHEPGQWYVKATAAMAAAFPAVGAFIDTDFTREIPAMAAAAKAQGAEWQQPVWHEYQNMLGSLHVEPGTDLMRERWRLARETGSTLIQYITWNDYGEETNLAPGYHTRYAIYDLTGYQVQWWKTGRQPKPDHDRIYLTYRAYPPGSRSYPFHTRRNAPGAIEVLTILTAPATIRLPGRDAGYEAPAGLHVQQFPLTPGPLAVTLERRGKVLRELVSPDVISERPFREDNAMFCTSTEEERHWRADFGETPMPNFSESGDDDGDGLPNWFEMYWFGRFLDAATASAADPAADPDRDGKTNIEEYLAQTDPTKPPPVYAAGYTWDVEDIVRRNTSFNPDDDREGTPVWHYLYKLGQPPIAAAGDFERCPHAAPSTSYTGTLLHSAPYRAEGYDSVYAWIDRLARSDKPADGCRLHLLARRNALIAVGWQSPVAGTVAVDAVFSPLPRSQGARLVVRHGDKVLLDRKFGKDEGGPLGLAPVAVQPGDRLLFILDGGQSNDRELLFDRLQVKLESPAGKQP